MVKRLAGHLAFASILALGCYSGLTNLAPFPCADDGTCPNGLICKGGSCTCPLSCDSTCVDPDVDAANCGGCGQSCATSCVSGQCQNACTLFSTAGCPSGDTCAVAFHADDVLWGTICRSTGTVAAHQPCDTTNAGECGTGLECVSTGDVSWCRNLCDATHACPGGATCNTNANIPNGGGFCDTPSACGSANLTVTCNGSSGTYHCPANSTCNTAGGNYCDCNYGTGYTCDNYACSSSEPCQNGNWWCD